MTGPGAADRGRDPLGEANGVVEVAPDHSYDLVTELPDAVLSTFLLPHNLVNRSTAAVGIGLLGGPPVFDLTIELDNNHLSIDEEVGHGQESAGGDLELWRNAHPHEVEEVGQPGFAGRLTPTVREPEEVAHQSRLVLPGDPRDGEVKPVPSDQPPSQSGVGGHQSRQRSRRDAVLYHGERSDDGLLILSLNGNGTSELQASPGPRRPRRAPGQPHGGQVRAVGR